MPTRRFGVQACVAVYAFCSCAVPCGDRAALKAIRLIAQYGSGYQGEFAGLPNHFGKWERAGIGDCYFIENSVQRAAKAIFAAIGVPCAIAIGIFEWLTCVASSIADVSGKPTGRHLIFLTDGETAPLDLAYSSYGLEPLDERRWTESSSLTLTQTVEKRFSFACNEVRKRNVTIWVIGFGTNMSDIMKDCAGFGHWFQADDAAQLNDIFGTIAKTIGELRVSK